MVDGIPGGSNIADIFQEKYKSLYNCVSFDPHQMAALLEETKSNIGNMVGCCSAPFIIDDINSSILLLSPRKSGGVSGCSSDHIINGTRKSRDHITICKSINVSDNYQASILSSNLGKVLDKLILLKYHDVYSTSDMQFEFNKSHSTIQCTFFVNAIVHYYQNNDTNVYVTWTSVEHLTE